MIHHERAALAHPVPPASCGGRHHALHPAVSRIERGAFHRGGGGRLRAEPHFYWLRGLAAGNGRIGGELAGGGQSPGGLRPALGWAEPVDDADGHRRGRGHSCLFLGLHAGRPGFLAFFRLPEPVHLFDAGHCAGEQLHRVVHLLGIGGRLQLFAHWLLVRAAGCRRGGQEGLSDQSPGRFWVSARHPHGLGYAALAQLPRSRGEAARPTARPWAR